MNKALSLLTAMALSVGGLGMLDVTGLADQNPTSNPVGKLEFNVYDGFKELRGHRHWVHGLSRSFGFGGAEEACLAVGAYRSGSNIVLSRKDDGEYWFLVANSDWQSIEPGRYYHVVYQFDRRFGSSTGEAMGVSSDVGRGLAISIEGIFLRSFASSSAMRVSLNGAEVGLFSLRGSSAAVNWIETCASANLQIDPFKTREAQRTYNNTKHQRSNPARRFDGEPEFRFDSRGVAAANLRHSYINLGEDLTLPMLKIRFRGFSVFYEQECEGGGCFVVKGKRSQLLLRDFGTGKLGSVALWGEGGTDSLGNKSGDGLRGAVGTGSLYCTSGLMTTCASERIVGLSYITGNNNGCLLNPREVARTTLPGCATIDGFVLQRADGQPTLSSSEIRSPSTSAGTPPHPGSQALESEIDALERQIKALEEKSKN